MSARKVQVIENICDQCGAGYLTHKDEELPLGFYITKGLFWIHDSGGSGTKDDLYFDTKECLTEFMQSIEHKME